MIKLLKRQQQIFVLKTSSHHAKYQEQQKARTDKTNGSVSLK